MQIMANVYSIKRKDRYAVSQSDTEKYFKHFISPSLITKERARSGLSLVYSIIYLHYFYFSLLP